MKNNKCKIDNCSGKGMFNYNNTEVFPKGFCSKHYLKLRKYGNPLYVKNVTGENRMKHPLYNTYCSMIGRCQNVKNPKYKNYGERGIKVCEEWLGPTGFNNFCSNMGNRPKNTTLDRLDNNKNYCKENCRWASTYEQASNKRNNNRNVGVYLIKKTNKYKACININKKQIHLGVFFSEEEAVKARTIAELAYLKHLK